MRESEFGEIPVQLSMEIESRSAMKPLGAAVPQYPSTGLHTQRTALPSAYYVWYVGLLLFVVNVFNYVDRVALSVLAPSIKADLALSDSQIGLLTGIAFTIFYALCAFPIARWADRGNRRNIIALALTVWSVMTALSGAAQNFWYLFLARVGVGAGESGGGPAGNSVLCDYVPAKRRPLILAINALGFGTGTMVGLVLAGWLGSQIGWRWTFVVLGLPGIALAALVRLTLREPQRGRFDENRNLETVLSLPTTLVFLWRRRSYRFLMTYVALGSIGVAGSSVAWWPSFLERSHGLDLSTVGAHLGTALGVGSATGMLLGGFMANKAAEHDMGRPLVVAAVATFLAIPSASGAFLIPSTYGALACMCLTQMLINVASAPALAAIYNVVPSQMRATTGAVTIFCQSALGFGLGPYFVGVSSDILNPSFGTESLRYALLIPLCLVPIAAIALYKAAQALPNDMQ